MGEGSGCLIIQTDSSGILFYEKYGNGCKNVSHATKNLIYDGEIGKGNSFYWSRIGWFFRKPGMVPIPYPATSKCAESRRCPRQIERKIKSILD